MKQYRVDEIRPEDYEKLKAYLIEHFGPCQLANVYWIPVDPQLMNHVQASHITCHPLYFALELDKSFISCEFLIRPRSKLRCDCIGYANDVQRRHIMHFVDKMFEELNIIT